MSYSRLPEERGSCSSLGDTPLAQEMRPFFDSFEEQGAEDTSKSDRECKLGPRNLLPFAIAAALLCTLVNVALTIPWRGQPVLQKVAALTHDYEGLEVGNSYINLDLAVYDAGRTVPKPIENFPLVVSRINAQESTRVYVDDTRKMSSLGLAYLEENEIVVDSSNSVILQFRILDFGMERCRFTLAIEPATYRYQSGSKIDVWELDAPKRFDPQIMSWSTRPSRIRLFSTLTLDTNSTVYESPEFHCRSRALRTFEVACSGTAMCQLEFRQDVKKSGLGFYLTQASSI
ncbi:hypothetical protein BKA70DRAFT_1437278 [Coprinopsis sp. MPI-PUGE-AT-0042]|nr:hypothetical protein BKA70DRAFT_1437278 [Coprinopsis sp. MPI-PUGE-AT-0042]